MNALFQGAVDMNIVDKKVVITEINELIAWQLARKKWHSDKTRRKMAAEGNGKIKSKSLQGGSAGGFKSSDFGLNESDIQDLGLDDSDEESEDSEDDDPNDYLDPVGAERRRRAKIQAALKSRAGEPVKPTVVEVGKLMPGFVSMLRMVLAE